VDGSFDTRPLDAGVRHLVYFDKEASVPFVDKLHPGLTGTVVVSASATVDELGSSGVETPPAGVWIGIGQGGPTTTNAHIKVGQAVNFYNNESNGGPDHHIIADGGSFNSGVLQVNQSFTFIFTHAGTFAYHDALDPNIKGAITVK
jgi:plastocyanin